MSRRSTVVTPLVCVVSLCGVLSAGEVPVPQTNTVSIRPKIGGLYAFSGDLGDMFDDGVMLQAEGAVKGTFGPFGFEFSLGTIRDNDGTATFTETVVEDVGEGTVTSSMNRSVGVNAQLSSVKLTGTYELNPLAGVPGHEKEGNLYFGGGAGYYPSKLKAKDGIPSLGMDSGNYYYNGYGVHLVVGAEYFFNKVFGVFAEVQYSYVNLAAKDDGDDLDLHGITGMAGFTLKF